jgi:PHD/YefM family antitoxin component YafN of YafNO toxin-antitoxin module
MQMRFFLWKNISRIKVIQKGKISQSVKNPSCKTSLSLVQLKYLKGAVMNFNLKEDVKPISYIKTNAADMVEYINANKNPIIITQHGEAKGVFLDIESYQDMLNALSFMKLLQFSEKSIREEKVYDNDQVFSELRKKLGKKHG